MVCTQSIWNLSQSTPAIIIPQEPSELWLCQACCCCFFFIFYFFCIFLFEIIILFGKRGWKKLENIYFFIPGLKIRVFLNNLVYRMATELDNYFTNKCLHQVWLSSLKNKKGPGRKLSLWDRARIKTWLGLCTQTCMSPISQLF